MVCILISETRLNWCLTSCKAPFAVAAVVGIAFDMCNKLDVVSAASLDVSSTAQLVAQLMAVYFTKGPANFWRARSPRSFSAAAAGPALFS